jgi:hypothetical protein
MSTVDQKLIGTLILKLSTGPNITTSHSFDITNDLPPDRVLRGPFFLCFGQIPPGHWVVHIRYSKTRCGPWRRIDELIDGISRSPIGRPVWPDDIVEVLRWYGLTPDTFTDLAIRLHNQIRKAEESSMASAT